MMFTETLRFESLPNGGTCVRQAGKMHMPMARFIRSPIVKYMLSIRYQYDKAIARAAHLASEEFTKTKGLLSTSKVVHESPSNTR